MDWACIQNAFLSAHYFRKYEVMDIKLRSTSTSVFFGFGQTIACDGMIARLKRNL